MDARRSRAAAFCYAAFGALQLVVLARYSDDVDFGELRTIVYLIGLVSILIVGIYTSGKAQRVTTQLDSGRLPRSWPAPNATP